MDFRGGIELNKFAKHHLILPAQSGENPSSHKMRCFLRNILTILTLSNKASHMHFFSRIRLEEAAISSCISKNVFLKISQYSQQST